MDEIAQRLRTDLQYYSEHQLKIRGKGGKLCPFVFNRAQTYVHAQLEKQLEETGRVRAIILKGRQQGMSTYIAARYFHKNATMEGLLTFIFAHDSFGSNSLYQMVKTYYENASDPTFLPTLGKSNAKELIFPDLRSGYKVGTAGTTGLGRSGTFQLVHWSEVAYSPNSEDHSEGLLQTVPDADGTEIILESTANGQGNYFHRNCMKALSGSNDFQLIFVPWYWQPEYTRPVPDDFYLEPEDEYYLKNYGHDGLTKEHLVWRRAKINNDFEGDVYRFKKEYPFNVQEAFEASEEDSYIRSEPIVEARNTGVIATRAPLVFGVDPARMGGNKFKICHRKGRNLTKMVTLPPMRVDQAAGRLIQEIKKYNPALINIDMGGLGAGVHDILVGAGYGKLVRGVNFGSTKECFYIEKYYNKRAEMYGEAKEWLRKGPVSIQLHDDFEEQALQAELTSVKVARYTPNGQLVLESKQDMRKRDIDSPDRADAFVLTFANPITPDAPTAHNFNQTTTPDSIGFDPFGGM